MNISGIKICVSGTAETSHCGKDAYERAKELGREVVRQNALLLTGATAGFPYWATIGAKELNGSTVGISPAGSEVEHIHAYKLPTSNLDLIIYTGFGFSGRNITLVHSSDAIIVGCGQSGAMNEFVFAYETGKPIGILEGSWASDEVIKMLIEKGGKPTNNIVFDKDPKRLVEKVINLVVASKKSLYR